MEDEQLINIKKKKSKKKKSSLTSTFFRNALRSNLDLTSLADKKAGILISINGFILTVGVTASSFAVNNAMMVYAFVSIIITSLGSIILAVLAVKPRTKDKLVKTQFLENYSSSLYYQDIADHDPEVYLEHTKEILKSNKKSLHDMIMHLHILGAEIKKKYFWLKQAYAFFSLGLVISASLMIYGLVYVEQTAFYNLSKGNIVYKEDKFYNVFEPSGATTLSDGRVLIAEDDRSSTALKLLEVGQNSSIIEVGNLYLSKKMKKIFKKEIEDLEAITSDGNIVYAITSHSPGKNSAKQALREKMIMFKYEDGALKDLHIYSGLKVALQKRFPDIFTEDIFHSNAMDIEGLVFDKTSKHLLIAFRAPLINGKAMVIALTNPKELFLKHTQPKFLDPIYLNLEGLGIRDLTYDADKGGYWIIAGSVNERLGQFQLWFWDKANDKLKHIKNHPAIGYGEGITVINKNSKKAALLIVEDNGKRPNKSAKYIVIDRDSI